MPETQGVNSVEIAVILLEALAACDGPARATDLARISGLSKSRLHKYLVSLCRSGMLYQDPETSLYSLGHKIIVLSQSAQKQNGELIGINNMLCQLRDQLNISTGLVLRKGMAINLTHYNRSRRNIDIDYRGNTPVPLSSSAAGKVFLTFSDAYKEQKLLDDAEYRNIRQSGYALRLDETPGIPGARAIACPVYNRDKKMLGAAVLIGFLPDETGALHQLAQQLMAAVKTP